MWNLFRKMFFVSNVLGENVLDEIVPRIKMSFTKCPSFSIVVFFVNIMLLGRRWRCILHILRQILELFI